MEIRSSLMVAAALVLIPGGALAAIPENWPEWISPVFQEKLEGSPSDSAGAVQQDQLIRFSTYRQSILVPAAQQQPESRGDAPLAPAAYGGTSSQSESWPDWIDQPAWLY